MASVDDDVDVNVLESVQVTWWPLICSLTRSSTHSIQFLYACLNLKNAVGWEIWRKEDKFGSPMFEKTEPKREYMFYRCGKPQTVSNAGRWWPDPTSITNNILFQFFFLSLSHIILQIDCNTLSCIKCPFKIFVTFIDQTKKLIYWIIAQ